MQFSISAAANDLMFFHTINGPIKCEKEKLIEKQWPFINTDAKNNITTVIIEQLNERIGKQNMILLVSVFFFIAIAIQIHKNQLIAYT